MPQETQKPAATRRKRLAALGDISNRSSSTKRGPPKGGGPPSRAVRRTSLRRVSANAKPPAETPPQSVSSPFDADIENAGDPQYVVPYVNEIQQCYATAEVRQARRSPPQPPPPKDVRPLKLKVVPEAAQG